MELNRPQIRLQSAPWRQGAELFIGSSDVVVDDIVLKRVEPNDTYVREPSFFIHNDAAQVLMDDLWNAGFRPSEGSGSAGALAATQKHLEDMRTLVFKKP